jgi:hypothetical protein
MLYDLRGEVEQTMGCKLVRIRAQRSYDMGEPRHSLAARTALRLAQVARDWLRPPDDSLTGRNDALLEALSRTKNAKARAGSPLALHSQLETRHYLWRSTCDARRLRHLCWSRNKHSTAGYRYPGGLKALVTTHHREAVVVM